MVRAATSMGDGASVGSICELTASVVDCRPCGRVKCALFETLLLNAGHPLHPSAPPVPLHLPPPGHEPSEVWSAATYVAPAAVWLGAHLGGETLGSGVR
jgi:hypothetical protein